MRRVPRFVVPHLAIPRFARAAILLAALVPAEVPADALAQGRPSSLAMTCAQSARLVAARGALVLGTGGPTYDRFVADRRFCEVTEVTDPAYVPTRDDPRCFVGYRCREPARDDLWGGD